MRKSARRWGGVHVLCMTRASHPASPSRSGRGFSAMHDRMLRGILAASMAAALVIFFIDPKPRASAADERALEQICQQALDSNSPWRFAVWHAAHEELVRLEP